MFNENDLVEAMARGEEFALELLFEKHYEPLWKYTLVILKNQDDAKEVVNETFFRAFRYASNFHGKGSLGGWLIKIAKNLCIDCLNKRKKQFHTDSIENIPDNPDTCNESQKSRILEELSTLKEEYGEIIILKDIVGYSIKEISQILGKSNSAVKTLHHRAIKSLRKKLDREGTCS